MMFWAIACAAAFLAGSIPFGLILARSRGVDLRAIGSGNIGATNVARALGMRLGLVCFGLDVLKGLVPTMLVGILAGVWGRFILPTDIAWLWLMVFLMPVLGHMFTPFGGFRGGKGVATGLGSMIGVAPILALPALGAFIVWVLTLLRWRFVGVSSCLAAVSVPALVVAEFLVVGDLISCVPFLVVSGALGAFVIYRHRSNLARTIAGTEHRFGHRLSPENRAQSPG
ncbi:MAG: glycerol-3-phosphate acyltransferase [Phycisphaeraceae bacterium]|nr:glycerol-3-phosphate acyltransferase [Phycisphaeraceae bacterium]